MEPVSDDSVENGLSPAGCSAILLQDDRRHPFVEGLQVVTFALAICPAFGHFFSEKFFGHSEIRPDCMNP